MRWIPLVVVGLFSVTAAACFARADAIDAQPVVVPTTCPITTASDSAFVPPPPYEMGLDGAFWVGSKSLWTMLRQDGVWKGITSSRGTRDKMAWWREGWKPDDSLGAKAPRLVVTARRIDGDVPLIQQRATNADTPAGWAMLVLLELASGCWEITGTYGSNQLSVIVWVPAAEPTDTDSSA